MMVVAREGIDGKPVNLGVVSERTSVSRRYLEQVAISLKNAGLLRAVPGRNGGHMLTRPAKDITLGEIVEAAIGPINIVSCLRDPEDCLRSVDCECHELYALLNQRIRGTFNAFTLADLAERKVQKTVAKELAPE